MTDIRMTGSSPFMRSFYLLIGIAFLCTVAENRVLAFDITACGQTVPRGKIGVLQVDLTCPVDAAAILMENAATLDLNSHTVKGGLFGVRCGERRCTIFGPGQIIGADPPDVTANAVWSGNRLDISNVVVSNTVLGVHSPDNGRIKATNLTVNNNTVWGLDAGRVTVNNLVANNNGEYGIQAISLKGSNIEANGNGIHGIAVGKRAKLTDVTANDNGVAGVYAERSARITGLTATGNGAAGFLGPGNLRLDDAILSGNDDDPGGQGIDLATGRRPRVTGVNCGRSARYDSTLAGSTNPEPGLFGTWDVCSED